MAKQKTLFPVLFVLYTVTAFFLFLFSYTQVDLNLTLSQVSVWQGIQKWFQYIGYYNRPLATALFVFIIALFYALYVYILGQIEKNNLTKRHVYMIIIAITAIGVFAYPAFSYDIFNYLFTAKTVAVYGENPYFVKPLAFAGVDPWLTFLHWTHLTSAYTPLWIGVSIIPFLLGFTYFLPILFNTKIMLTCFYLLCVWGIGKIVESTDPRKSLYAMAVFAFSPLVYIEAVVSPHNDIVMMACAVMAWYLATVKRPVLSYLFLALSVAFKLMTLALYPLAYTGWKRYFAFVSMCIVMIIGFWHKEILPWYFLWIMPFVAVVSDAKDIVIIASGLSLGLLMRYAPYIYYGDYQPNMLIWRTWVTVIPTFVSIVWVGILRLQAQSSRFKV